MPGGQSVAYYYKSPSWSSSYGIEVNIYLSISVHHFSVLHTTVCDIQFVRLGAKRKSRMDNPETQSILGTKYRTKHKKTIQKTKKTNKN